MSRSISRRKITTHETKAYSLLKFEVLLFLLL